MAGISLENETVKKILRKMDPHYYLILHEASEPAEIGEFLRGILNERDSLGVRNLELKNNLVDLMAAQDGLLAHYGNNKQEFLSRQASIKAAKSDNVGRMNILNLGAEVVLKLFKERARAERKRDAEAKIMSFVNSLASISGAVALGLSAALFGFLVDADLEKPVMGLYQMALTHFGMAFLFALLAYTPQVWNAISNLRGNLACGTCRFLRHWVLLVWQSLKLLKD
jgi:hypothetical protein